MKLTGGLFSILVIAGSAHMGSVLGSDIYVDPDHTGSQTGSQSNPFVNLWRADQHAESGDTIHLSANVYPENITFAKRMTITSTDGASVIGTPNWIPTTVGAYLFGVVYKPGSDWVATPGFESFVDGAGDLDVDKLRYVMLAPLWMPPRDQVRYVFLFSSGQQQFVKRGSIAGLGGPQITTGALDEWAWDFPGDSERVYRHISTNSIASKLIRETAYHDYGPHNTLLILAFKGGLQGPQEPVLSPFDPADRKHIIDGYYAYLNAKADLQNVDTVYLCGISRGGALASRLGKRIRMHYANQPEIYISTIDGHVIHDTQEMLSTPSPVLNPVAPPLGLDRYAWYTQIDAYYTLLGDDEDPDEPFYFDQSLTIGLHVFNTVTSVIDIVANEQFRTYCSGANLLTADEQYGDDLENPLLWGWFRQRWVNYDHQDICENWHSNVGLEHVDWFLDNAF